jgi:putative pyruvate formate lyase activating enzyme
VAQVLAAVAIAAEHGLRLPLVYNSGGYDSLEALALLDGVVDIYMPDMKYRDAALARKYSHVRDYVRFNRAAVREMHRQVGDPSCLTIRVLREGGSWSATSCFRTASPEPKPC